MTHDENTKGPAQIRWLHRNGERVLQASWTWGMPEPIWFDVPVVYANVADYHGADSDQLKAADHELAGELEAVAKYWMAPAGMSSGPVHRLLMRAASRLRGER